MQLASGAGRLRVLLALILTQALVSGAPALAEPETSAAAQEEALHVAEEELASKEDGEPEEEEFDPYEGMDRDGRIPKIELPPDIEHPDRWRYIPEGRIKPGNVFQRFLTSSFIVPLVFSNSDVGTGGGISITDIDFRGQRRQEAAGLFLSYTSEGQQNYTVFWQRWLHHRDLPEGGVIQEERSFANIVGGYSKTLTRRFYGIGPDTEESAETSYTDALGEFKLGLQLAWPDPGDPFVVKLSARGEFHNLSDGNVSGVPSTCKIEELRSLCVDSSLGYLKLGVRWDERDSQAQPYSGWMVGVSTDIVVAQSGNRGGAAIYTLFGTKIFRLPGLFYRGRDEPEENPPTDTFVVGGRFQFSSGRLPFFALPELGGPDTLRGYFFGRFRDRASWLLQSEYRFWFIPRGFRLPFTRAIRVERVGAALFYEVGAVAPGGNELFRTGARHSYGIGLRAALERAAPFRLDFGFSEEGDLHVIFGFGLSF